VTIQNSFFFWLLALNLALPSARAEEPSLSEKIVSYYESDDCPSIEQQFQQTSSYAYGPIVRAVIADCLQDAKESEAQFDQAQKDRPNNQIILVLRARHLRKTQPEKSMDLWRKVRLYARGESIKRMAEDYISGVVDLNEEDERLSIGRKTIEWIYGQAGISYASNPSQETLGSSNSPSGSWGNNFVLRSRLKNETEWGDFGAEISTAAATYFSNHFYDNFSGRLDLPVGFDSGDFGSVVYTPFATHELQGHTAYHSSWGLSVMGVALNSEYRQSVQAILYRDRFYDPTTQTQAGDHYRFQYDWLFYPEGAEVSFGTFIEHVHATVDKEDTDQSSVNYSHNDIGLLLTILFKFRFIEFGIGPTVAYRQDTNDSSYFINGAPISKRRHDFDVDARAHLGIPLQRYSKLELFYDYGQVFSNFSAVDVQNYNYLNRIYGFNVDLQVDWL
jgi:hypothetical protein